MRHVPLSIGSIDLRKVFHLLFAVRLAIYFVRYTWERKPENKSVGLFRVIAPPLSCLTRGVLSLDVRLVSPSNVFPSLLTRGAPVRRQASLFVTT